MTETGLTIHQLQETLRITKETKNLSQAAMIAVTEQCITAMRREAKLAAWIKKHGRHSHDCKAQIIGKCICGISDIRSEYPKTRIDKIS